MAVTKDAFERMPVALVRVAGPDHRFVAANGAYRSLMGQEDLLGRTPRDVLPELVGRQQAEVLDRVFRSGEAEQHHACRTQVPQTGTEELTERYLDLAASPYFSEDGAVSGVDMSLVDVTDLVEQRAVEQRRAQQLAHRARQQYAEARELVMALQDALLPGDLPVLPCLELSARYLLASDDTAAGGDWFDAVVRDDGTVALVVGDVVGHGVAASAVMGQLRAALHQRLLTDDDLGESLEALDRYARSGPDARAATVCVAQLDPATGALAYCTAGHPAPLVVGSDGRTRFLEPTGGAPLATHGDFPVRHEQLAEGELLLLYTDGILERPGVPPSRSTLDLARVAGDAVRHGATIRAPDRVCEEVLELLIRLSGYRDDITLLAARPARAVEPLRLRRRADHRAVRAVREELADWLERLGVRPLDELCVQHAVGELVTNAVEHAYPPGTTGSVRVDADVDATGHLVLCVRDQGSWAPPPDDPHRGHGLALVHEFVDHVSVERHGYGTAVTIRHRLARPAHLLRADNGQHGLAQEMPFEVDDLREERRLVVRGVVDVSSSDSLRHSVLHASHGGTTSLVVDLAGVTHLASAGVQVLSEVTAEHAGLELRAPVGSVAQHVLETVRLPYATGSSS